MHRHENEMQSDKKINRNITGYPPHTRTNKNIAISNEN
jgi:hypothetical protein